MAERRKRGLGRGLGALIPDSASSDRPVDVFFSGGEAEENNHSAEEAKAPRTARTDPAASMQSSRRRKPKSGSTAESAAAKTPEQSAPDSGSAPSKNTSGSASTKSGGPQAASKKSTSGNAAKSGRAQPKSPGTKTTTEKPAGMSPTTTKPAAAKAAPTNSAANKSAAAKAAGPKSAAAKTTNVHSADPELVGAKSQAKESSRKGTNAAPDGSSPSVKPTEATTRVSSASSSESEPAEATQDLEVQNSSTVGAPAVGITEPDTGATTVDPDVDRADQESPQADDVSETHPGVYRSGHEVFDKAQDEQESGDVETTEEVEAVSGSSASSASSASDEDDDQSAPEANGENTGVDSIPDTEFGEVNVELIEANPRQPRTFFDEDQLSELVHSIREIGVLQPVVVRQKPGDPERFELIMGERRLRATKDAGLSTIPAIIRYVDDTDMLRDALLENLHRAELNPLEEAAAYGQLLEDFGCTQEELSERIGRSRPQISNTLRLLRLPPLVQRRVAAGVISAGHARAILGLREPEHMEVLAQRIVAEGLSVRASEEAVVLLNRGDSVNVSRATSRVSPQFIEVAERLGDRLDTKVNITVGKKKGKLSVEFANQTDLDRILSLLGVESPTE